MKVTGTMLALTAAAPAGLAHMSITMNNLNAGNTPVYPRQKATVNDNYRSPDNTVTCHGTTSGSIQGTIAAGTTIEGRSTYGAGHGGGHCAWMVTTDQQTYYKINDKVDCTVDFAHDVTLPTNLPTQCATTQGCTLVWFWTPLLSGACEIYQSCFDVRVTGAVGGIESTAYAYVPGASPTCTRVNDATHITPNYGPFDFVGNNGQVNSGTGGTTPTPTPTPGGGGSPGADGVQTQSADLTKGCISYTVKSGDTLDKIAQGFDIEWPQVQVANTAAYPSLASNPDAIEIGWTFMVPQTECAVAANSCDDPACARAGSAAPAVAAATVSATATGFALLSLLSLV